MIASVTMAARGTNRRVEGFADVGRDRRRAAVLTLARRGTEGHHQDEVDELAARIAEDPALAASLWLVVDDRLGRALAARMDPEIGRDVLRAGIAR